MITLTEPPSSALSLDVADFVYFQQHIEPDREWIRVGWSGTDGKREDAQNEYEPVAVIRGCYDDEQNLHRWFDQDRVAQRRDRSTYAGSRIYDYVVWLLERNHAGRDRREAERLPMLPWSVWGPQAQRNEGRNGELSLFTVLPRRDRLRVARSDLAHLSSESDDWYTPAPVIEAARVAMGGIDLDPATCVTAQRQIQASLWYTKAQDGLRTDLPWKGRVWLNPPYGRGDSSAAAFVQRLIDEIAAGHVEQAITCLNLASSCALWFDPVWTTAASHCVYRTRLNFWNDQHQKTSPTKGTILSYFGEDVDAFNTAFRGFGRIIRTEERL